MAVGRAWSATIDLSSGDYTVPSGVVIEEVRTTEAGDVSVMYPGHRRYGLHLAQYDVKYLPEGACGVWKSGTSAALLVGKITLFGKEYV